MALLRSAAGGSFPPGDFTTTHLRSPSSPADAVLSFFGHHVLASDVDSTWVRSWTDRDPFALSDVRFLAALADKLGVQPGIYDATFATWGEGADPEDVGLVETQDRDHPRVIRALAYRDPSSLRVYVDPTGAALLVIGRGLAGRWEAAYEVDPAARGRGLGTALVAAARRIGPSGEPMFMQVSPGNVWSMRALAHDRSWHVIGSEILFHREPSSSTLD
jgi:GNAT superfamily N-acetyltransferase